MPYIVDGHNLIPKLGLRLDSADDELELIAILQEFCRLERRQVDVYFDGAPSPQTRKHGSVTAHFVRLGETADNAIRRRLKTMSKSAKNWSVVSSDRQVQAEARTARSEIISSDEFAKTLKQVMNSPRVNKAERTVSKTEVDEWLDLFNKPGD